MRRGEPAGVAALSPGYASSRADAAAPWCYTECSDDIAGAKGCEGAALRADTRGTGREDASITFSGLTREQVSRLA